MSMAAALGCTLAGVAMIAAGIDLSHRVGGIVGGLLAALAPIGVLVAAAGRAAGPRAGASPWRGANRPVATFPHLPAIGLSPLCYVPS